MFNKPLHILPLIILLILLIGGIYYYQQNQTTENSAISGGQAAILGNSNTVSSYLTTNEYVQKINDIRKPINEKMEDLMSKLKYKTLFEKEQLIKDAKEIKNLISDGKKTLTAVNIASNLKSINEKEIQSLDYLDEAITAYIDMQKTDDQKERQKQLELMNYKIEQSNKAINDIKFSTSGSSDNNASDSSQNVLDVLQ